MSDQYKKFGVNKKTAKPGELLEKARSRKFRPIRHKKHKMTQAQDDAYDAKHGINEGSAKDIKQDAKNGIMDKKHSKTMCKMCDKSHAAGQHEKKDGKKHKNWISGAIKHPGALHRELGVKAGHKIPAGKLRAAAKKGGTEGKRARLAETLKSFHHKR